MSKFESTSEFRKRWFMKTAEERRKIALARMARHTNYVPVILTRAKSCKGEFDCKRHLFLVPCDHEFGQFVCTLRSNKRKDVKGNQIEPTVTLKDPSTALFFFTENDTMPAHSSLMSKLYHEHKNKDDLFLYVNVSEESTFG